MHKVAGVIALAVAALLEAQSPVNAWTPPIGIPTPPFGINEVAGLRTHYVDNTSPGATDTNNPNGSVTTPRLTIPAVLAAGSVVEVHGGPYIYNTAGPVAFTASGTALAPVFIRGIADGGGNKPIIKGPGTWQQGYDDRIFLTAGTYYIVEGFRFSDGTTLGLWLGGSYAVVRNSEFVNYQKAPDGLGRQYGAALSYANFGDHHHIIYNNTFRDIGNYLSTADNKMIGIKYGGGQRGTIGPSYVWILNNDIYHNGQGMQFGDDCVGTIVGGACQPDPAAFPNHFYIGFNTVHRNRENGIGMKMTHDFIISQNEVYDMPDLPLGADCSTSPSPTPIIAGRSAADNMWVLFNRIHDAVLGLRSNGQDEGLTGPTPVNPKVYWIGNLIYNITGGNNCLPYDATNPYSGGAAMLGFNAGTIYAVDNTIADSAKGISFTSTGYYEVTGNVVKNTRDPMSFIPTNWGTNLYDYNFYDPAARLAWNSPTPIIALSEMQSHGQELHSRQGAALLDTNYKPVSGSPIVNANVRSGVYDTFLALYGIDIAKDIAGTSRPQGPAWDMGAYELPSASVAAPTGLVVR